MERLFLFQKGGSVSLWDELGSDIFCLGRIEGGLLSHWGSTGGGGLNYPTVYTY
uniref:Uncharacterized protein n=1 Tax=Meloidogyne enterolobii TaxID=390850 RepID=A0A6V7XKB1_MELEN|nr:unnamed protein product [Meloidogyne enterolobii]